MSDYLEIVVPVIATLGMVTTAASENEAQP